MTISPTPKDVADMITMSEDMDKVDARMATPHTPGPWHLDAKHLSIGSADGLRSIANVAIPGEYGTSMPADVIAADANARLIAAAPEMLEALRLCAQFVGGAGLNDGIGNTLADGTVECLKRHEAAELIRAAIAKATLP